MVFFALRWAFTTVFFNVGLLYAVFIALRQSRHVNAPHEPLNSDEKESETHSSSLSLPLDALKLWMMLTFLASLSFLGADAFPFFLELRAIFTWLLLAVPPLSHAKVYDAVFAPLVLRLSSVWRETACVQSVWRRLGLVLVRGGVELSIWMTHSLERLGTLEEDAVHDIVGGLVFARRALQDAASLRPYYPPSVYTDVTQTEI